MVNSRPPASNPPTADPPRGNSFQSTLGTNNEIEHSPKKMHQAPAPILDENLSRVAHRRTLPGRFLSASSENADEALRNSALNTSSRGAGRSYNGSTIISMRNPTTRGNGSARQDPHAGQTLIPSGGAGRNPYALWNPNWDPHTGRNPNRNPNTGWDLRVTGN